MHPLFKGNICYYLSFEMFFEGKRTIHCLMWTNLETKSYNHCYRKLRAVCILFLLFFFCLMIEFFRLIFIIFMNLWCKGLEDDTCTLYITIFVQRTLHKGDRSFMHIHVYIYEVLSELSLTSAIKLILSMLCLKFYKSIKIKWFKTCEKLNHIHSSIMKHFIIKY